jgi:8-amino-7-oxononanoate synthase
MDWLAREVEALRASGLLRTPHTVGLPAGPTASIGGREVAVFCSNNYLGLADHPALQEAAAKAAHDFGVGSGASRLISGTSELHLALEARIARFAGFPSALVFATGYHANTGAIPALAGPGDVVFSDALNHASIIDGCRLSRARVYVYPHGDGDALEALLRTHRGTGRALIVTDALFSMDGDRAPLRGLRQVADRHDAALYVDEAHSLGVHGPGGRGLSAEIDVRPDVLMGTLGKAFGVAGAFVAGPVDLRSLLVNKARSFVYSTAPPPPVVAAALAAVDLVEAADDRREALQRHVARLGAKSAIHPIVLGDPDRTMRAAAVLLERGHFVPGIRPPTVPEGTSRLRVTLMATHTSAQVDALARDLADLR